MLLDRDGDPLGTVLGRSDRHTFAVTADRMGRWFPRALIAAEDGRFYRHGALDPLATGRAFARAIATRTMPGGASTIAMQLARTLAPMPRGLRGKIAETLLAARIENGMSKSQILAAYANRAPMGANIYGVEAAARTYFGIDAAQLDLAQSAALAALPNAPSALDPYTNPRGLHARVRYVLGRMRALGFIDANDELAAANEDLDLRPPSLGLLAPQYCFFIASQTAPDVSRVRTSLDAGLQRFVEGQMRAIVRALGDHDVHQSAAIVLDNRTGDVLAYAGSVAYSDVDGGRNDGVQALRQPGSALKPFLYELAFERRDIRPFDILEDVPTAYAIPGGRLYAPTDYSTRFLGPVRPRIALADSLNVPAVRVLERVGVPAFLARLHALGFSHLDRDADYYGLGLTLGGGEVSLWELAHAYLQMERYAQRGAPEFAEITDMLADDHARAASFGVDSILALPYAVAVKTGTSSDYRDTWTVGYSRAYTVAVWVGNFDGSPMHAISGVSGAGPIWSRIMRHLHESADPAPFDPPRGWRRAAVCTTQPRLWKPGCTRAYEWLDARDLAALGRIADRPLAVATARIVFPREGDVFVASAGSGAVQTIDVRIASRDAERARVRLDGATLDAATRDERGAAYVVRLRPGDHELRLDAPDGASIRRFSVVTSAPRPRAGFTLTSQ